MFGPTTRTITVLLWLLSLAAGTCRAQAPPAALVFHASQAGKPALDEGEGGGNPFASALIELLARPKLTLPDFASQLSPLTAQKSRGLQIADVPAGADRPVWTLQPKPAGQSRAALVIVYSDYALSGGASSLPGAKHDAARVAAAFSSAGFATVTVVDPDHSGFDVALQQFSQRSANADIAAIYTTGHGVEVDGTVYLLPGNYPVEQGEGALQSHGVRLSRLADAVRAKGVNLVFYGGCRDNPFAVVP